MRLPIKAKISLAAASTVGLVAWLIAFMLYAQKSLADSMNRMIDQNMAAMRMAEQIKYDFVLCDDLVFRYLFTGDPVLLAERGRVREKVQEGIRRMTEFVEGRTEKELLAELEEETALYDADVKRLLDTYRFKTEDQKRGVVELIKSLESGGAASGVTLRESQKQTLALLSAEGRARLVRIHSQCEKLADISRAKLEEAQRQVRGSVGRAEKTGLASGAAAAVGTVLVAVALALSLLSPLQNLLKGVQRVTAGELDLELPVEGADEVGRLTQQFNTMTRHLREKQEKLVTETITDSLTELHNFRYFQTHLKEEISRAARYKHGFALLIADIDHFKHYNDANGHPMGNVLLKQLAALFRETFRREDFLARYGGEEFVAILPETDRASAAAAAERLRQSVAHADLPSAKNQPGGSLTLSIGGAVFPADGAVSGALLEAADKALYAAKARGRNRVVWADELAAGRKA
jgi:diguanylate cyclase (GGDEF)-like protein